MAGPLKGFRIIDFTTMVSGPIATMMLADQGADVIKIEPPGGEYMRKTGVQHRGMPSGFLSCNRNKRSLSVDLKRTEGLEVVKKLAANADVLVQNFRPGAIERMGLGEDVVRRLQPKIIYVSISGFGETGPYSGQRVYDPIIQAISGLADIQRDRESGQPKMVRTIIPDKTTSVTAAQAITAALLHRERTGEGQHVRLSMLDTMIAFLWPEGMSGLNFVGNEVDPGRAQMGLDLVFQTLDGYITAAAVADSEWAGLCRALRREELITDPKYKTPADRSQNQMERRQMISDELAKWKSDEILDRLKGEDVPCAPILDRWSVLEDEQVRENEVVEIHDHPILGQVRQPRPAARFDRTPAKVESLAPFLGADNSEILSEAGYSIEDIERLERDGVFYREELQN
ncbi:MAG: Formyl-CoA:oxalate CoA-transferase [Alphaproteobacteria bacterium MarineAlpha9_Bin7]|nr:MAG: Formyl-CoA:oxalate CoA-transferase [Alphaproteobacteria bacterium MarineAlpha9_Bin7]